MDEITDATKGGLRRVELLMGAGRRRRWSAAEKAQIVAETLVAGTRVSDVARRWQLHPQQVFGWRREARQGAPSQRQIVSRDAGLSFVPLVAENDTSGATGGHRMEIEIALAGTVVRVKPGVDSQWLTAVLRAVRGSLVTT